MCPKRFCLDFRICLKTAEPFWTVKGGSFVESGKVMGYARVSSAEQNPDRQIMALGEYVPVDCIVVDKASGKDLERPGYQALKGLFGLRAGDTLYIMSLDRLSRNKEDIKRELQWFRDHGIRLKVLDLPTTLIDVPEGQSWIIEMVTNILIEVLSSLAEQERLIIRKRQREGIDAAKKKGKHLGRPKVDVPNNWDEVVEQWKRGEITARDAMRLTGLKRSSFYAMVKETIR